MFRLAPRFVRILKPYNFKLPVQFQPILGLTTQALLRKTEECENDYDYSNLKNLQQFDSNNVTSEGTPIVLKNFYNSEFDTSYKPDSFINMFNPGNGKLLGYLPNTSSSEVNVVVTAADEAFKSWSKTTKAKRSQYLNKIADIMSSPKWFDKLCYAEALESGKKLTDVTNIDIPKSIENFRHFARIIVDFNADTTVITEEGPTTGLHYLSRKAKGVAGLIAPWNFPLFLLTWKIAPALASGCTVVCKPSELTSLTTYYLSQIVKEAQLPPGVFNVVFGSGSEAGHALVENKKVKVVSFTGGSVSGAKVSQICSQQFKTASLELGGKNPCIIMDEVDLDEVVPKVAYSAFLNQGQICLAISRIYVHSSIYDKFLEKLVEFTKTHFKVSNQFDSQSNLGALSSHQHLKKVEAALQLAIKEGAKVHLGGSKPQFEVGNENSNGYYFSPTILTNLPIESQTEQTEIFGPVVSVTPYDNLEEAVELANNSQYGLAACVYGNNLRKTRKLAQQIDAGMVWVNCWLVHDKNMQFGGFKASGLADKKEGGIESLALFTKATNITLAD